MWSVVCAWTVRPAPEAHVKYVEWWCDVKWCSACFLRGTHSRAYGQTEADGWRLDCGQVREQVQVAAPSRPRLPGGDLPRQQVLAGRNIVGCKFWLPMTHARVHLCWDVVSHDNKHLCVIAYGPYMIIGIHARMRACMICVCVHVCIACIVMYGMVIVPYGRVLHGTVCLALHWSGLVLSGLVWSGLVYVIWSIHA